MKFNLNVNLINIYAVSAVRTNTLKKMGPNQQYKMSGSEMAQYKMTQVVNSLTFAHTFL